MCYTGSMKFVVLFTVLFVTSIILSGCGGPPPPINHSPTIINLASNPPSPIEVNQSTTITCIAFDQDGDTLTYIWSKTGGTISGSGSAITWTAPATAGTYAITCTVSDGKLIDSQSILIVVSEPIINHPPVISGLTANPSSPIEANQSTTITCYATDQDGDTLTYIWTKTEELSSEVVPP